MVSGRRWLAIAWPRRSSAAGRATAAAVASESRDGRRRRRRRPIGLPLETSSRADAGRSTRYAAKRRSSTPPPSDSRLQCRPTTSPMRNRLNTRSVRSRRRADLRARHERAVTRPSTPAELAPPDERLDVEPQHSSRTSRPTPEPTAADSPPPVTARTRRPPTELTPQLLPAVQRGYALAQRGRMSPPGPNSSRCCGAWRRPRTRPQHRRAFASAGRRAAGDRRSRRLRARRRAARSGARRADRRVVAPHARAARASQDEFRRTKRWRLYHSFAQEQLAASGGRRAGRLDGAARPGQDLRPTGRAQRR